MLIRRVLIVGEPHWGATLSELLRLRGFSPQFAEEIVGATGWRGKARMLRWVMGRSLAHADVVHQVFVPTSLRLLRLIRLRGLPLVFHWIGTDVVNIRRLPDPRRAQWVKAVREMARMHLADSPELADEVAELGFDRPKVVRLLPVALQPRPLPLPDEPAVLSYWTEGRAEFYGGHWVLQLARAFPEVPFHIVGQCTRSSDAPSNVIHHGWVDDIGPWYDRSTVLIRMPKHDSVSVMVLEMLARARYVIYSRPFSHCHWADDYASAHAALSEVMGRKEPNHQGPAFVAREFNPQISADALAASYHEMET